MLGRSISVWTLNASNPSLQRQEGLHTQVSTFQHYFLSLNLFSKSSFKILVSVQLDFNASFVYKSQRYKCRIERKSFFLLRTMFGNMLSS